MLSRRARRSIDGPLCVVLGLLFTWNWVISQSPTNLVVEIGSWVIPSRVVLLVSLVVAGLLLFLVRRSTVPAAPRARKIQRYAAALFLGLVILAMDIVDGSFDGEVAGPAFFVQSVAMGVASAYLYMEIGSLFGMEGALRPRVVSVAAVAGLLLCSPLQMVLFYTPGQMREGLMVAFLVAMPSFYDWLAAKDGLRVSRHRETARMPLQFAATLLLVGIALGMLQGVFSEANTGHSVFNPLSALGFPLAALVAAATILCGHLDYNHIIYQVDIPILACGFAFVALGGNLFVGFVLCLAGYYAAFVSLWVLGAYLTAESPAMVRWLFALVGAVLAAGQALGLIAVDMRLFGLGREDAVVMVVVLLLACLYLSNSSSPYESWGIVKPAQLSSEPDMADACELLAAETRMTKREREILPLLAQGRNRKVIAEQLVLSENTVKTHISNLYAKVHVHSQQELIELVRRRMVGSSDREERSED